MDVRTSCHLWLQRHPLIVVLLDQIRSLLLETHRDDPLLDREDSVLRWTFGLDQIRSLLLETHRDARSRRGSLRCVSRRSERI